MSKYIPREQLEPLMCKPGEEVVSTPTPSPQVAPTLVNGRYELMPHKSTYALGVQALRNLSASSPDHPIFPRSDGSDIIRPLSFNEVIRAKLEDFNTLRDESGNERSLDDRLKFFDTYIDSSTGIAYKRGTKEFKIIPLCEPLITIDRGFNDRFMAVNYDSILGAELDSSAGKYGELLTKDEIENHPAWRTALLGDVDLLRNYRDVVFEALKGRNDGNMPEKAMGFWVLKNLPEDQLLALFVYYLNDSSNAYGNNDLSNNASFFLRVAQGDSPERPVGASRTIVT
jgi:hypothetical protein